MSVESKTEIIMAISGEDFEPARERCLLSAPRRSALIYGFKIFRGHDFAESIEPGNYQPGMFNVATKTKAK